MTWRRLHPLTRIVVALGAVLGVALFTGWERVGQALANISPGGSFKARCDGLPGNRVEVALQPYSVTENASLSFSALSRLHADGTANHRTIGLTQANFGHRSTIEVKGLEDRAGGRACVRPRVKVELYVKPMTVYVAREYSGDPCRARVIREHEQRHVAVYAGFAREAVSSLERNLAGVVGAAPRFAATLQEAQHGLDRDIDAALTVFMRDAERTLAERQASVDTPEEYRRVATACNAESPPSSPGPPG